MQINPKTKIHCLHRYLSHFTKYELPVRSSVNFVFVVCHSDQW